MQIDAHMMSSQTTAHSTEVSRDMSRQQADSNGHLFLVSTVSSSLASTEAAARLDWLTIRVAENLYFNRAVTDRSDRTIFANVLPALIDISGFTERKAPSNSSNRFFGELFSSFESEPIEDGSDHPSELIVQNALITERGESVLHCLRDFSLNESQPSFSSSVIRCLARFSDLGSNSWRTELISRALRLSDVQIRDAAVQAAEHWGGESIRNVLSQHQEPIPWLRKYADDVVRDLTEY